jgi:hypothetical protein
MTGIAEVSIRYRAAADSPSGYAMKISGVPGFLVFFVSHMFP